MRTVLLPTDFSANANRAITYAIRLFGHDKDTHFVLLNTFQMPSAGQHVLISLDDVMRQEAEKDLNELRASILEKSDLAPERLSTEAVHGSVVSGLNRAVTKLDADLVVLGTKGASGTLERWMGSNAAAVVRDCPVPVIAVPENAPLRIPHQVALAADNQDRSAGIARLAEMAEGWGASVLVFHVDSGTPQEATVSLAEARSALGRVLGNLAVEYETVSNDSVEVGIEDFVRSRNADMLAMVTQRKGFFDRLFQRSKTRSLAMSATVPLLILKND